MNADQLKRMYELFEAVREGAVTDEQFAELDAMMAADRQVCRFYYDYFNMCAILKSRKAFETEQTIPPPMSDSDFANQFWQELADHELTSPAVEVPVEEPPLVLVEKVRLEKTGHKINKFSLAAALMSTAALLAVLFYLQRIPVSPTQEVAVLSDAMHARWADPDEAPTVGQRLTTQTDSLCLLEGFARLTFDNEVEVIVEGPAEFRLHSGMELAMDYGRLYARVSDQGKGFMVVTENSRIIDLGTEFGVTAAPRGDTELQVFKGQTALIAGHKGKAKHVIDVTAGFARRVDRADASVSEIPSDRERFVRAIDSRAGLLWRGQRTMDLVQLIGGGSGFEPGASSAVVDFNRYTTDAEIKPQPQTPLLKYVSTGQLAFVDGAFVPDGGDGEVQIASSGLTREGFPDTSNEYNEDFMNSLTGLTAVDDELSQSRYLVLDCQATTGAVSSMHLHTNTGITFDLAAIRRSIPGVRIAGFRSRFEVAANAEGELEADILVLVDGQDRFARYGYTRSDGPLDITVPLDESDRFLTIVCTEGVAAFGNWPLFVGPVLELDAEEDGGAY